MMQLTLVKQLYEKDQQKTDLNKISKEAMCKSFPNKIQLFKHVWFQAECLQKDSSEDIYGFLAYTLKANLSDQYTASRFPYVCMCSQLTLL